MGSANSGESATVKGKGKSQGTDKPEPAVFYTHWPLQDLKDKVSEETRKELL